MKAKLKTLIERGIRVGDEDIYDEDILWMRYSGDKVDIGEALARVVRTLCRTFPARRDLRALSIGSGSEPQFRVLEAFFRGGLYLLDIDRKMLDIVRERIRRQAIRGVTVVRGDYNLLLLKPPAARRFFSAGLAGKRVELITLHHSLYYSAPARWTPLFENLYRALLSPRGAIHAVMMSSQSRDPHTTTWLYNHFAGKYFGVRNDQDLLRFARELRRRPGFRRARIITRTDRVRFFPESFEQFMAVVWMILLYPEVHKYTRREREEITEYIYRRFWTKRRPLFQDQDHLVILRGMKP